MGFPGIALLGDAGVASTGCETALWVVQLPLQNAAGSIQNCCEFRWGLGTAVLGRGEIFAFRLLFRLYT